MLQTYQPSVVAFSVQAKIIQYENITFRNRINYVSVGGDDLLPLEGSPLRELRLALCQLEWVNASALRPLQRLRALHLGQNAQLNASVVAALVQRMADDGAPLDFLGLNEMGFRSAPPRDVLEAAGAAGVASLVLARNQFPVVAAGAFPRMPRLRHLDLSECLVVAVEEGALAADRLPALRSLVLAGNQLTGVLPGVLPPQVATLDLSLNSLDRNRRSVVFDLGEGRFVNMSNLIYLNISFNNINTITPRTFKGLAGLREVLCLQNSSIVEIHPGSFKELGNLTFLNLEKNPFPEYSGLTAGTFEGLESLEVLLLAECGITNFSDPDVFSALGSLQYLMLENNYISSVSRDVLSPLTGLRGLDLSHNRMEPWIEEELFSGNPNLSIVFLADNKLTYLSPVMLEDFSKLGHLDIYDNPFSCECEPFYHGKEWLSRNNLSLERIFSPGRAPLCYTPDSWRNKFITDFIQLSEFDGECPIWAIEGTRAYIIVGVVLGMLMVLGSVCGAMAYKYRSHIRYWMFLARRDLRRRGITLQKERRRRFCKGYTNYQYDAFVSYSSEDRNFVVRLVAMLENYEPHLKLCVYERDFQIGTVISEAVLESVACSRRTLLVISDAFARSQWCMWELRLAEHYSLFFDDDDSGAGCGAIRNQDPLVMVKLGDVAASHMTPTLKHLLRTRVYLDWDPEPRKQRQFWEKLRAALAPPPPPAAVKTNTTGCL
ncbi:Toll-like receptor Tollo [Gryllus bimaculatus]|nr:Toll-like receptor Tollo [Gryllus bimaculatus]